MAVVMMVMMGSGCELLASTASAALFAIAFLHLLLPTHPPVDLQLCILVDMECRAGTKSAAGVLLNQTPNLGQMMGVVR